MKISPVYTMPFSFHSGLGLCLHDTVSPCTVMVSPHSVMVPLRSLRSSPMHSYLYFFSYLILLRRVALQQVGFQGALR